MKWINLKKVLNDYGNDTVKVIKEDIRFKKLIRTGTLLGSITFKLVKKNDGFGVEFFMVEYGKFVDQGTVYIKAQKFFKDNIKKQYSKWEQRINDAVALDFKDEVKKTFSK